MSIPIVEITEVVKAYDQVRAVDGVSLNVGPGAVCGLLGPNGAGKTSTIRMLMRIILPDQGDIRIFGEPLRDAAKERIGYMPEERGLYKKMKIADLLTFFGQVRGLSRAEARRRGLEWLERLELSDWSERRAEDLSKGMQQKVQFVITVIHEPELIILDEPFSGLDPINTNVLKDIVLEYRRKGHTVIFSTHMMDQVEKLCDEICMISKGKVVLSGTLESVKREYGQNGVTLRFSGDASFLRDLPEVEKVSDYGNEVFLRLRDGSDPGKILSAAAGRLEIEKFEVARPSIHDIFIEKVRGT